jgi:alpha-N-acetylglucosamine transferase
MPCRGDEYIVREWLLYKLYNLVTPKSFKARLVKIELDDTQKKKKTNPFYGILLEDDVQMAKRNNMIIVHNETLKMQQTEREIFLQMAVFEYLIGNTDWSVTYLQNVKLIARDSLAVPYTVPYDFDHAGMVNAPYALPAEELQMRSVLERRYRGFCITDMQQFAPTFALYNGLKDAIYKLYTSSPLLDAKYLKSTIQYLDEFYNTINNGKKVLTDFGYPCDKNGTGNVIIKGLREN